jgi:hypothetical protein
MQVYNSLVAYYTSIYFGKLLTSLERTNYSSLIFLHIRTQEMKKLR